VAQKFSPVDRIKKMRVLTIAVPASHDVVAVEKTLVNQPILHFNKVELVVHDNASIDSTWEKANYVPEDIKHARVIGQSEDVGFARNLKAFSIESSAQFNWFAGYGDRLAQNLGSNVFGWISEKLEIPLGWQDALKN